MGLSPVSLPDGGHGKRAACNHKLSSSPSIYSSWYLLYHENHKKMSFSRSYGRQDYVCRSSSSAGSAAVNTAGQA
eukprot:235780-Rhodomonas_salina.2